MAKKQIRWAMISGFLLLTFMMSDVGNAQVAANAKGDLWGSNTGNSILLKWSADPSATEYVVYRGTSVAGPWTELFRDEDIDVGGMREDVTSDAKLMDLCYKVEAFNGAGQVIRNYEPICLPRFVG